MKKIVKTSILKKVRLYNYYKTLYVKNPEKFFEIYKEFLCERVEKGQYRNIFGKTVIMSLSPISWAMLSYSDNLSVAGISHFTDDIDVIHIDSYALAKLKLTKDECKSVLYHVLGHFYAVEFENSIKKMYGEVNYAEKEYLADAYNFMHNPEAAVSALKKLLNYYISLRKNHPEKVTEVSIKVIISRIEMMMEYIRFMMKCKLEPGPKAYRAIAMDMLDIFLEVRAEESKEKCIIIDNDKTSAYSYSINAPYVEKTINEMEAHITKYKSVKECQDSVESVGKNEIPTVITIDTMSTLLDIEEE